MWIFALLVACRVDEVTCGPGTALDADGICQVADDGGGDTGVPDETPPTLDDVLAALPDCVPTSPRGVLDLEHGCAGDACAGMTLDELVAAIGEEPACERFSYESGTFSFVGYDCAWSNGLSTSVDDDGFGAMDRGAPVFSLDVDPPFKGGSDAGLGLGAGMKCFVEGCAEISGISFDTDTAGDWVPSSLYCRSPSFNAYDWMDAEGGYGPDGVVESLSIYAY